MFGSEGVVGPIWYFFGISLRGDGFIDFWFLGRVLKGGREVGVDFLLQVVD